MKDPLRDMTHELADTNVEGIDVRKNGCKKSIRCFEYMLDLLLLAPVTL